MTSEENDRLSKRKSEIIEERKLIMDLAGDGREPKDKDIKLYHDLGVELEKINYKLKGT